MSREKKGRGQDNIKATAQKKKGNPKKFPSVFPQQKAEVTQLLSQATESNRRKKIPELGNIKEWKTLTRKPKTKTESDGHK